LLTGQTGDQFRYRDSRSGKWIRPRYVATRDEIEQRYAEWEILRPAELRDVEPDARYFTPHAASADVGHQNERPLELQPTIDAAEVSLLAIFLRRYVTYCARRGRFAAMNGAARLAVR
jgi:hypothetical protein